MDARGPGGVRTINEAALEPEDRQSVLMPSEIELGETIQRVVKVMSRR